MKKFISLLVFLLLVITPVNATTEVTYNRAGSPVYISHGSQPRHMYPISSAALQPVKPSRVTVPARPIIPSRFYGYYPYARRYYTGYNYYPNQVVDYNTTTTTTTTVVTPSRLNSNAKANIPTSSYTINGVTYYN